MRLAAEMLKVTGGVALDGIQGATVTSFPADDGIVHSTGLFPLKGPEETTRGWSRLYITIFVRIS